MLLDSYFLTQISKDDFIFMVLFELLQLALALNFISQFHSLSNYIDGLTGPTGKEFLNISLALKSSLLRVRTHSLRRALAAFLSNNEFYELEVEKCLWRSLWSSQAGCQAASASKMYFGNVLLGNCI